MEHFRVDETGRDGVDSDTAARQLARKHTAELLDGGLGVEIAGATEQVVYRADS